MLSEKKIIINAPYIDWRALSVCLKCLEKYKGI